MPGWSRTGHFFKGLFGDAIERDLLCIDIDQTIQTEILQKFEIAGAGIENVQEAVAAFLELEAEPEQNTQKRAIEVRTGVQIDDKAVHALLEELLVKCLETTRVLKGTAAYNLDKSQSGTPCHQNFR